MSKKRFSAHHASSAIRHGFYGVCAAPAEKELHRQPRAKSR